MADPFYEPLPGMGQAPWDLNGPIQEIRERIGGIDDFIAGPGIESAIAEAAAGLNPEALSDVFIADQITAPGSDTRIALTDLLDAIKPEFFGAAGDGVTDDTVAVQAAIDAAATLGQRVQFTAGSTYRLTASIKNNRKALFANAEGAKFLIAHGSDAFQIFGSFDDSTAVTSLSSAQETDAVSGTPRTINTVVTATPIAGLVPGDLIRIVADDIISGSKEEFSGATAQSRVGDFLNVVSVSGTTIRLAGYLTDSYTTNIRLARMNTVPFSWTGGTFDYTDAAFAAAGGPNIFFVAGMVRPSIERAAFMRFRFSGVHVRDCYGWRVVGCDFGYGINDLNIGANAYGVANSSSSFGVVDSCWFRNCRHGYSDGSGFYEAGLTRIEGFGRAFSNTVINCTADSCTGSGFDTHTQAIYTSFVNCTSKNNYYGFGLRGRGHQIQNCLVINANRAVWSFQEVTGDSWGHLVDGLTAINCASLIVIDANNQVASPNYNIRETRPVTVRNLTARGLTGRIAVVTNATLIAADWNVTLSSSVGLFGALISNSSITLDAIDVNVPSGVGTLGPLLDLAVGLAGGASINYGRISDVRIIGNPVGSMTYALSGSNPQSYLKVERLTMSNPPSTATASQAFPVLAGTVINY